MLHLVATFPVGHLVVPPSTELPVASQKEGRLLTVVLLEVLESWNIAPFVSVVS